MLIRMIKRWLFKRRLIKFFEKNSGFYYHPTSVFRDPDLRRFRHDSTLERGNLIKNVSTMSNSRCVSGFDVIKHMTVVDLDELDKVYNLEEKKLYFADKTAQL